MDISSFTFRGKLLSMDQKSDRCYFTIEIKRPDSDKTDKITCTAWVHLVSHMSNKFKIMDTLDFSGIVTIHNSEPKFNVTRWDYPCKLSVDEWYDKNCKEIDKDFKEEM